MGNLDRARLAEMVFSDGIARKDLEAITHPKIRTAFEAVVAGLGSEAILVSSDPALGGESHPYPFNFVVAVSAKRGYSPSQTHRTRNEGLSGGADHEVHKRRMRSAKRSPMQSLLTKVVRMAFSAKSKIFTKNAFTPFE
jgi:dephospho-CoA kinase